MSSFEDDRERISSITTEMVGMIKELMLIMESAGLYNPELDEDSVVDNW